MKMFQRAALAAALMAVGGMAAAQNIAVVNGKPITRAKADAFVQELIKQGQQDTPQLQALVRQELVDREILVQEAERRGLSAKNDVKFQLDNARQQVLINALVQDHLSKSAITDADIRAEYDRLTKGDAGKEYRARHILVEKEDEAKAKSWPSNPKIPGRQPTVAIWIGPTPVRLWSRSPRPWWPCKRASTPRHRCRPSLAGT